MYLCFLSCVLVWLFGALCLVNQSLLFEHQNRLITGSSLRELNDNLTLKQSNTPRTTDCPILINIDICIFYHITIMFLIVFYDILLLFLLLSLR